MQQMKRMVRISQSSHGSLWEVPPQQCSCCPIGFISGHLNRDKPEENTAVSWWVFAEKSWHAPSLGKGTPVVAGKLTDPYQNKKEHTK